MAAPHGSRPVPPDRRPYRRTSEPGPETTHEPGSVAPLYVIAHVDELDAEDEPHAPAPTVTLTVRPDDSRFRDGIRRMIRGR